VAAFVDWEAETSKFPMDSHAFAHCGRLKNEKRDRRKTTPAEFAAQRTRVE
jgi:hypothetical protein